MKDIIDWLLKGESFVEYRTRIDLLEQSENESKVRQSRKRMIEDPKILLLLRELKNWPGTVLSSHKSASQPFHKLSFIADMGLRKDDPQIKDIIKKIFEHTSEEGPFQLPTNIPKHFGGSGTNEWAWALCDAPTILYSLAKFGLENDAQVQKAVKYLVNLFHENGWRCVVSKELGKFRGPGRKDDPCPYATLVMLKMLAQFDEWRHSSEAHVGTECLLDLWKRSLELHPYMFYMGTDFRKIKAPLIWYDILHVLDVLSKFDWLRNDSRLIEMSSIVKSKADKEGKYTP
ncbi:MAG: hypothetical protein NWE80_05025, partial [Candidatus Bathyarchaeota archaeon]|nr:hypothetical protein [Candidatus Bathyarchaeota archaeon]